MDNVYSNKMITFGLPLRKIYTLNNPKVNTQRCLCTHLLSQGDCRLKEIVEHIRKNEL